jgi:hypothetical protein
MLDPLGVWKGCSLDLMKPSAEPRQGTDVRIDGRSAQILEKVIVEMRPIERGLGRKYLMQVREIVVDKMRKRLRWVHA